MGLLYFLHLWHSGPGGSVGIATELRAGKFEIESPVRKCPLVHRCICFHIPKTSAVFTKKKALRNLESCYDRRDAFRYEAVLLRQWSEENRDIKGMRVAKQLLGGRWGWEDGEHELFKKQHCQPKEFSKQHTSVRTVLPDWILDYWHPLEKTQHPEYFARRELRKKQCIET